MKDKLQIPILYVHVQPKKRQPRYLSLQVLFPTNNRPGSANTTALIMEVSHMHRGTAGVRLTVVICQRGRHSHNTRGQIWDSARPSTRTAEGSEYEPPTDP